MITSDRFVDPTPLDHHRPWPLPSGPWIQGQTWLDLLFAHWAVPVAQLRRIVPPALRIDTFRGEAWVGVVPFRMTNVHLRGLPSLPEFPELNVRTYVTVDDKPGVYFFSFDTTNLLAVLGARAWYRLPYFHARMRVERSEHQIQYVSRRIQSGTPGAELRASYGPTGSAIPPDAGTLEYFLTERYCLYTVSRRGNVFRAEIHHPRWELQPAEAEISLNTMTAAAGITLPDTAPLLHFSRRQDMVAWPPARLLAPVGITRPAWTLRPVPALGA
jgi:uncharacterized protein